jgi:hypothetical protein
MFCDIKVWVGGVLTSLALILRSLDRTFVYKS